MSPTRWRSLAILVLPFVAAVVAGCASPATPAPVASAAAPVASASVAVASVSGDPACQGTSVALGGMLVTTNPNVSVALPPGWRATPMSEFRRLPVAVSENLPDPLLKRAMDWELAEIDSGTIRAAALGISRPSCAGVSMFLAIRPSATSVEDAVAAWRAHSAERGLPETVQPTEMVDLPIGRAGRLTRTAHPPGAIPSQSTEYIVLLPNHQVAILAGTSPASDTEFPALVDAAAQSMRGD